MAQALEEGHSEDSLDLFKGSKALTAAHRGLTTSLDRKLVQQVEMPSITLITGGPGSGKTTQVEEFLSLTVDGRSSTKSAAYFKPIVRTTAVRPPERGHLGPAGGSGLTRGALAAAAER